MISETGGVRPTVLIFRTGQLGDTLVALPAIEAIRKKYPGHSLVLLTDRQATERGYVSSWEILAPTGWFDRVIYYDPNAMGRRRLNMLVTLLAELRDLKADHFFNLTQHNSRWKRARDEWCFSVMAGARNYHAPAPARIKTQANLSLPWQEPEWSRMLRGVGAEESEEFEFRLPILEHEREIALRAAQAEGIDLGTRLMAVGPGSKRPTTKWPVERFAQLGRRLQKDFPDLQLVVLGGKEDISLGNDLCRTWGEKGYTLAGKLTPYGSASILEKCIAYVGNDTGTTHLAGMAGIPCVGIFSARTYPGKWEPYGKGHIVLRRDVACAGCGLDVCEQYDNECLKLISVDDVYTATQGLIKSLEDVGTNKVKKREA